MQPAIEFERVTKVYRGNMIALDAVSFAVDAGEICAFLGPNGAGKTTSINILMGFTPADSGDASILGYAPGDIRAKRDIGFVPENFVFYRYLTGSQLLRFHAKLAGLDNATAEERIPKLLARVRLSGYEQQKIGEYSRRNGAANWHRSGSARRSAASGAR